MKRLLVSILLFGTMPLALAVPHAYVHPKIKLMSIVAHKSTEKYGDELYIHISVYPLKGKPDNYTIPKPPMHWLSKHLSKVNNVKLWDKKISVGDAITVIISLLEKDAPPWNTNDLIGSVRVQFKNDNGKLETSWSMPNRSDVPESINTKYGMAKKVELLGADGHYNLYFLVE